MNEGREGKGPGVCLPDFYREHLVMVAPVTETGKPLQGFKNQYA